MAALLLIIDGVLTQVQLTVGNGVGHGAKSGAGAGAVDAVAAVDLKQSAVGGTQYVIAISVEKAVRHPVEFEAGMGTAIAIQVERIALAHGENTVELVELKALCAVIGDIVDGAEKQWVNLFFRQVRCPYAVRRCTLPVLAEASIAY